MAGMRYKSNSVKTVQGILLLGIMILCGCRAAHEVAVTSFRVLDAPANYVRRQIDHSDTTTTTTTVTSDAVTPGRTVNATPRHRPATVQTQPKPTGTPRVPRNTVADKPKPSSSAAPKTVVNPPSHYPTAKPVPGKPGYVFSPFDPSGGYVDVNGYASGSKVKDPYSGKVFLVP
jgi:hypothetical protein